MGYPPPYYVNNSPAFMADVMRAHSFAVLTSAADDGELYATHLPFIFKESESPRGTLYGHISARNPHVNCLNGTARSMAVFNGPHGYISASWYNNPERRVPTWNYVSVKAKGRCEVLPQSQWVDEMTLLAQKYELDNAWHISMAEDYTQRLMSGITYFKMPIDDIMGVAKLSANKDISETKRLIKELRQRGENDIADAMELNLAKRI